MLKLKLKDTSVGYMNADQTVSQFFVLRQITYAYGSIHCKELHQAMETSAIPSKLTERIKKL
jgi:hypothetical protein